MGFTGGFHKNKGGGEGSGSKIELSSSVTSSSTDVAANSLAVKTVNDKVETKADINHNHDTRYYRKDEIDNPGFMANRIDNITIELAGRELKVRSIDGLVIGVAQINEWLAGTSGNIQTQIDGINDSLLTLTSGMKYLGKIETYADLQAVGKKENGNLAVVLADESRSGGRSMYVYSESLGAWEFIGEFTFTDAFLALKDTPTSYAGAAGKVVKVAGERLVFGDIEYGDLANRPKSTITEIDDAVGKKHEHTNSEVLARLGINADGELTVDGIPLNTAVIQQKQYLHVRRGGTAQNLLGGTYCVFNVGRGGSIPYNATTGAFTLEADKTYKITVTGSFTTQGWVIIKLVYADTGEPPFPNAAVWTDLTGTFREASAGPLEVVISPTTTRDFKIRATSVSGTSSMKADYCALTIVEI